MYLQVTTDIAQQRNIEYAGDDKKEKGANEYADREEGADHQEGG